MHKTQIGGSVFDEGFVDLNQSGANVDPRPCLICAGDTPDRNQCHRTYLVLDRGDAPQAGTDNNDFIQVLSPRFNNRRRKRIAVFAAVNLDQQRRATPNLGGAEVALCFQSSDQFVDTASVPVAIAARRGQIGER